MSLTGTCAIRILVDSEDLAGDLVVDLSLGRRLPGLLRIARVLRAASTLGIGNFASIGNR